eukprot:COSAG03_NODE_7162_length_956_cov_0.957993_1_plen_252_part_10
MQVSPTRYSVRIFCKRGSTSSSRQLVSTYTLRITTTIGEFIESPCKTVMTMLMLRHRFTSTGILLNLCGAGVRARVGWVTTRISTRSRDGSIYTSREPGCSMIPTTHQILPDGCLFRLSPTTRVGVARASHRSANTCKSSSGRSRSIYSTEAVSSFATHLTAIHKEVVRRGRYFGFGVMPCWRGPALYDDASSKAAITKWVRFYKTHRDILSSDIIHLRRADHQGIDAILHVNPALPTKGLAMIFNPMPEAA